MNDNPKSVDEPTSKSLQYLAILFAFIFLTVAVFIAIGRASTARDEVRDLKRAITDLESRINNLERKD